ncbi:molybdopterin-dependent oxidoreductase [Georgenia sp. AZ-5]|uniref:molybdopterin-dependent oxidoreductase n=1 Tax=Georgenia sp. AZ-5 TaxID=3367526 RepID=UPI003754FA9D
MAAPGRGGAVGTGVAVVAGAVALAELLTRIARSGPGPVEAVAEAFIDLTPPWLKDLAIGLFGTSDKLALGVGIALVVLALAAAAGLEERRRGWSGGVAVVLLGAVAALAAVSRPDGGPAAAWPVAVSALVGAAALVALTPRAAADVPAARQEAPGGRAVSRRGLLGGAVALTAAALAAASVSRLLGGTAPVARLALPAPATRAPPAPPDPTVDGLTPFRTPNAEFYRIDTAFVVPRVDPATWRLRVVGLVERETTLTLDELLAAPLTEAWVTLCCVSNPVGGDLAGNARWLGLPVREVLARARPLPGADMVLSRSVDGFTASTPLEVLTDDRNALLAVGMNGTQLPAEHGYPVRLVVPGLYGYVSATKWVTELRVTRFTDETAYWTERGWSARGPVKTSSRIDVPRRREVRAGEVVVAGVAWAQHTGIAAVEVRVDGGRWRPAELATDVHVDAWRQWFYRWTATPGEHVLEVRATDRDGGVQTGERRGTAPDGATGWHRVEVRVA